jgi:hypothetical protein
MIKKLICLAFLYSTQMVIGAAPDRFMDSLPGDRKLKDLSLLGAHDAGAYTLYPAMGVSPDEYGNFIYTLGHLPVIGGLLNSTIIKAWSQTQTSSMTGQLSIGVRYFDLRFAPDSSGNFRVCHGLFGPLLDDIIRPINAYLTVHPTEIVLLDFTFFDNQGKHLTWDQQNYVIGKIQQTFNTKIAPSSYTADVTLEQMWQGQKQVIIFWKDAAMARVRPDLLWDSTTYLTSTWYNKTDWNDLEQNLNQGLAMRPPGKFYVNQAILTPDANMIFSHLFSSLLTVAETTNASVMNWYTLKAATKSAGNILMIDNVNSVYKQAFQISMKYNLQ